MGAADFILLLMLVTASYSGCGEGSTILDQSSQDIEDADYDFIIVGAGSSGSVIANRLSEISSWNILLLEAGDVENSLAELPTMNTLLQFTDYNWGYTTEPQPQACLAMEEQRCAWPRGKALGGSSVINYMVYSRGNPEDYNRWAALNNPGWSYADVLPYFLKSEDSHLNNSNEVFHSRGGYLSVENPYISDLGQAFISAGLELGYENIDYNSPEQIGFSRTQATLKQGRRYSAAKAFLEPILRRKNLKILTGATVTKILIDPSTKRAFGVEYTWQNKNIVARAEKEVVLSAGVLNSPKLLMLSGIGPKGHLDQLGIATLNDLPVGQTIYNHVTFAGLIIHANLSTDSEESDFYPLQLLQLYNSGNGPLASPGGNEAVAFIKTDVSQDQSYPDVELLLIAGSIRSDDGKIERKALRITDDYFNQMFLSSDAGDTFTIIPVLLHPKSRGFLKLVSTNPHDAAVFHANTFTDPENRDLRTLAAAIRFIMQLIKTQPLKKFNTHIDRKPFIGCEHLPFYSDEHWMCALQLMAAPAHHQTSTCKMGPSNDPTAIVNHQLKVYGIGNLRVADTSIIPIPISAHTSAPAVMIGEMASDIIKKEWETILKLHVNSI